MSTYKIIIADSRYPGYDEELGELASIDAEVIIERSDDPAVLAKLMGGTHGLIANLAPITAEVIAAMDVCKCVSRYGVGYDNVDTAALKAKGVMLANVPTYCMEDVSDHAVALMLDAVRKIAAKDRRVREGQWNLTGIQKVYRIAGKTLGLIGYGGISRVVHRKMAGFNPARVLVFDPFVSAEQAKAAGVELIDLPTLCAQADFISVHAPLNDQTHHMLGAEQFAAMKPTAIVVNTSRGGLIDTAALIDAVNAGTIAWAGLDVFESEPLEADSPLRGMDHVTLTDHAGWYSEEAMVDLKTLAARNIVQALTTGTPDGLVKL